ncbi:MAG TPA: serine/threonine-protein kinase [Burkholderiales bacterium]|nr:serine/threonine-protein kinase [Burkholderiales bacterium]
MEAPKLGRYIIQSEIGRGAMGVVYKATDSVLERTVAVKTVNMSLEQDGADKYEARFYQEARAAAGLNHPNIVTVHDVGKSGEVVFMAMEYIEGVELRSLMGEGQRVAVPQAVAIAAQVAEGLAYAHQHGVVHRDIKPANIMVVPNGPAKITDFGIARRRATSELTQTGMLLGSPKYMSPEQVIGKRADHRSDIFSLGVILYEMVCGAAPFNGENVTALMYQTVNFVPPPPSSVNKAVPEMLDFIVAKMLAKPIEERYLDANEVTRDLRECERQLAASGTQQPHGTLPGTAPVPQLANAHARTVVLAQSVNRDREADKAPVEVAPEEAPSRIAPSFDSLEATQRLAAMTGAATTWAPQSATQAVSALPRPAGGTWRRRDWLLVGGAAVLGVVLAGAIARKRD